MDNKNNVNNQNTNKESPWYPGEYYSGGIKVKDPSAAKNEDLISYYNQLPNPVPDVSTYRNYGVKNAPKDAIGVDSKSSLLSEIIQSASGNYGSKKDDLRNFSKMYSSDVYEMKSQTPSKIQGSNIESAYVNWLSSKDRDISANEFKKSNFSNEEAYQQADSEFFNKLRQSKINGILSRK
jgi:hypothetical protein